MAEVAIETAAAYAAADAETTLRLLPLLQQSVEQVHGTKLMDEIEMPLISVPGADGDDRRAAGPAATSRSCDEELTRAPGQI